MLDSTHFSGSINPLIIKSILLIAICSILGCEKWRKSIYPIESVGFQKIERPFGYSDCEYGTGQCQPCVDNVLQQIERLATEKGKSYTYQFPNRDLGIRFSPLKHAQGVARIPGLDNENWLVIPRHHHRQMEQAGMISLEFPSLESKGAAWKNNSVGQMKALFSTKDNEHPGGCQIIGQTLVVAHENGAAHLPAQSWLSFYDVAQPTKITEVNRFYMDGSDANETSFPLIAKGQATCVAITRLQNEHYLLFALDGRRSLRRKKGWFFLSTHTDLATTDWEYRQLWQQQETLPNGDVWRAYESLHLLADCKNGQLYLCCFNGSKTNNAIDVFELTFSPKGKIVLQKVLEKTVNTRSGGASFRAGATFHITPDQQLVLYTVEKDEMGK